MKISDIQKNGTEVVESCERIEVYPAYQLREEVHPDVIEDYMEVLLANNYEWPFEPLTCVRIKIDEYGQYSMTLVDGYHRLQAAIRQKILSVPIRYMDGTEQEALEAALSANHQHGARRTNADKRKCVLKALGNAEFVKLTDTKVARLCGVSQTLVFNTRKELKSTAAGRGPKDEAPDSTTVISKITVVKVNDENPSVSDESPVVEDEVYVPTGAL